MSGDAMELREFIALTLTQIAQGVRDAQGAAEAVGAHVNPVNLHLRGPGQLSEAAKHGAGWNPIQTVTFDVALTLDKTDMKKGRIGVAAVFAAGVEGEIDTRNQRVNRVRFAVPILLPGHPIPQTPAPA
jgi:hypothetical protein